MSDDITQKLRTTMPDFKGLEISCPCRIRSLLMKDAADEIEKLTRERDEAWAALKPFAALFLWPDDSGEWTANDIRSDYDWDEKGNDVKTAFLIERGHIRAARKALESKP